MGKSQTRKLKEATRRFGREDFGRWYSARAILSSLVLIRKKEAGLIAPTVIGPVFAGPAIVKRYNTHLSYEQNEATFGIPRK